MVFGVSIDFSVNFIPTSPIIKSLSVISETNEITIFLYYKILLMTTLRVLGLTEL